VFPPSITIKRLSDYVERSFFLGFVFFVLIGKNDDQEYEA